ncbi:MAG: penicillin-binding protein 2 [Candidatus Gracilibacteria bacterium]|nr:penicillin-binding protein 2 [Candidatus Gracilibacteria bacterium]MDD5179198.1 penicillin-binding protein 2 [Candidatus Gracilibacteria bacterium]
MQESFRNRSRFTMDRFQVLFYAAIVFFAVICARLGYLQIMHADDYRKLSDEQNSRGVVLPAKRGNIYARDYRTDELFPLAQNSTTYTIFIDPMLLADGSETKVLDTLFPMLWQAKQQANKSDEDDKTAAKKIAPTKPTQVVSAEGEKVATADAAVSTPEAQPTNTGEENQSTAATPILSDEATYRNYLIQKFTTKDVVRRELHDIPDDALKVVTEAFLPGVSVESGMLVINPTLIDNPDDTAIKLATILGKDYKDIYPLMVRKKVRYAMLANKVSPDIRDKIEKLAIRGVGSIPEYRRVYPEGSLAAQVVGFLDHDEKGVYGIEGKFNDALAGKNGLRRTQVDPFNRQITVGDITIQNAQDGESLVLTIDRAIQTMVETSLKQVVDNQRADSGQVIVMDPHTGAILALAHYPTFDPNNYSAVYEREDLIKKENIKKWVDAAGNVQEEKEVTWETPEGEKPVTQYDYEYIIRNGYYFPVYTEYDKAEQPTKKMIFKNRTGEGVFALRAGTSPYEPGSVFKPIVMSMALDAGEVTPTSRGKYNGPVQLDEMLRGKPITIKNALGKYWGFETMTEIIEHSSNIGMTFVAQKLGRATFYDYLKKFGFGERTDVEFEGEDPGYFANYTKWTESELVTKGFGQGITVNLFQMASAYSALANGGLLMKPYIVDKEILPSGQIIKTEPKTIRRVIDEETSAEISQILISSVRNGYAIRANIPGYFVGGKTGTSQTYSKAGFALNDIGTTIATFGGYAPATDAKFIMICKVDKPRGTEWGEATAGVIFRAVTEELLKNYFAIPPEEVK